MFAVALVATRHHRRRRCSSAVASSFESNLTSLTGLNYDGVIATAEAKGYTPTSGIDWGETFKFLVWPLLPLLGAIQSIGIGGEIKKVRRSQLVGMLGAVIGTGVLIALFAVLSNKAFGYTFQGAVALQLALGDRGRLDRGRDRRGAVLHDARRHPHQQRRCWPSSSWPRSSRGSGSGSRRRSPTARGSMIAWSFDRLAPSQLGYVSRRFHTPVVAIGIGTAGLDRVHVADRVPRHRAADPDRGAAGHLGHRHGRRDRVPVDGQAVLQRVAGEGLSRRRRCR